MSESAANTEQVIRMLTEALEQVRRRGAIGCEMHIQHGDGVSEFRSWNACAMNAAEAELAALPVKGGWQ
jgi:glutamate synthase domain-containing protein 1